MKNFKDDELIKHIESAISQLNILLHDLINTNTKRAVLLGYWIKDYTSYIRKEDSYEQPKYKYNRGDVVQINFGYRIGREIGGRHFAVVIDNSNSINQETITVVPLMSLKEKSKNGKFTFILNKGLYELHNDKYNKLLNSFDSHLKEIESLMQEENDSKEKFELIKSKLSKSKRELNELKAFKKSHQKLKSGSIIDVGQIVTVSKMRLLNPKNAKDSLSKIKLSNEDLDLLNNKLKTLYINKY
ncbi:MAG: type II toxin-antitoxin system PemK/MazF family toxin [Oscillospiraceae bacterium]|nr:type II toxin-antitoxin system PemK/MazF family toxin [Oscillospiraceae bacterium]